MADTALDFQSFDYGAPAEPPGAAPQQYAASPAAPPPLGGGYSQPPLGGGGGLPTGAAQAQLYGNIAAPGGSSSYSGAAFGDEPPLLEELGINFGHIKEKTLSVLHPFRKVDSHIMDDTDLTGPLLFCLLFGAFLLGSGKVQFGYIYGVGALGCLGLYGVLNLMSEKELSIWTTASVLGYCLLPMVALSSIAILLSLAGIIGMVLSTVSVAWCTYSASKMFVAVLGMDDQRLLIAYPCGLLYGVFALLAVF